MLSLEQLKEITRQSDSTIVLLVIDGLGGLPRPETGKTELESAHIPNLASLVSNGTCGLTEPVSPGITPGSAPGHLALFGYDPIKFAVGRGILEAMGIDFDLKKGDVAARGNFCTIDSKGLVIDRRAGRISTEENAKLCKKLSNIKIEGVQLYIVPVKEHRFLLVFRGEGLSGDASDSDPQQVGVPPLSVVGHSPGGKKTAELANEFAAKAKSVLADSHPANMVLLRGFSQHPNLPTMNEIFKLNPAAIAAYPMYRGLAKLVGMKILNTGATIEEEFDTLVKHYAEHDFFFIHAKKTDSTGEDGDFAAKVHALEEIDRLLPKIISLSPDVLIVTGDHSTPAMLKGHSWHPVPLLLYSKWCRADHVREFGETACASGGLGKFPAVEVMPLAMANALKMTKFGA